MTAPGTPAAITAAPFVVAAHTGPAHTVTVGLSQHVDMLRDLARALHYDDALMAEFRILGRSGHTARQQLALSELTHDPAVRDALTLTIAPSDADALASALIDAADEPGTHERTVA